MTVPECRVQMLLDPCGDQWFYFIRSGLYPTFSSQPFLHVLRIQSCSSSSSNKKVKVCWNWTVWLAETENISSKKRLPLNAGILNTKNVALRADHENVIFLGLGRQNWGVTVKCLNLTIIFSLHILAVQWSNVSPIANGPKKSVAAQSGWLYCSWDQ